MLVRNGRESITLDPTATTGQFVAVVTRVKTKCTRSKSCWPAEDRRKNRRSIGPGSHS